MLRPPGVRRAWLASLAGRVSLAMTGLALLLLIKQATGSYASAGLVSGCYAVTMAIAAPVRARSADRRGASRVLRACSAVHPLAFGLCVVLAEVHAPVVLDAGAALLIGITVPPIGGVIRALWGQVLEPRLVPVAFAMEAVVIELCFVVGPLAVAVLSGVVGPWAALLLSGLAATGGGFALANVPVVRATVPDPARPTHLAGPLVSPTVRACLLAVLFVGASFGAIEVGVLAFVEQHGHGRAVAGVVLAVWSVGSVLGGLVYGGLDLRASAGRQLPVLVTLVGVAATLPLLAPSVVLLSLLLLVAGSTIAPWSTVNSLLLSRGAPAGTVTEAFAWNGSMIFGGAAAGTALAGVLADASGARGAFVLAAAAGGCVFLVSVLALRALSGAEHGSVV